MKLLLDENLSDRIVPHILELFPESTHIKTVGLAHTDDRTISEWGKQHGFTLVSKDTDFYHRSIIFGHPPKFIWLRVGNCPTRLILDLLRSQHALIRDFIQSEAESLFVLERLEP